MAPFGFPWSTFSAFIVSIISILIALIWELTYKNEGKNIHSFTNVSEGRQKNTPQAGRDMLGRNKLK